MSICRRLSDRLNQRKSKPQEVPEGFLLGTFDELKLAGCLQCELDSLRAIFAGLMSVANGNPCKGCPKWESLGTNCPAFRQYHTGYAEVEIASKAGRAATDMATTPTNKNSDNPEYYGLSIRAIATKLGISISEARRRKAAGTL